MGSDILLTKKYSGLILEDAGKDCNNQYKTKLCLGDAVLNDVNDIDFWNAVKMLVSPWIEMENRGFHSCFLHYPDGTLCNHLVEASYECL